MALIPPVSVVIPSYNQRDTILRTLGSLKRQTGTVPFEVIVVDSSRPSLAHLIRIHHPDVRVISRHAQTFAGVSRNLGIEAAKGKYVLFTDTDCVVEPRWVSKMARLLKEHEAVGGSTEVANPKNPVGWALYLTEFTDFHRGVPAGFVDNAMTSNLGVRAEVLRHAKFPSRRRSTDQFFCWSLRKAGVKIWFEPKILVRHVNTASFGAALKTQYWIGFTSMLNRRSIALKTEPIVRRPWLLPLVPAYRFFMICRKYAKTSKKKLLLFLALSPLTVPLLWAHALGMWRGRTAPPDSV